MKPEVLNKIVSDVEGEFAEQLQIAFKSLIAHESAGEDLIANRPAEIQTAIDARDLATLRKLLGISADGTSWPRATQAITQCLTDELMPIYDYVRYDAWKDLGESSDDFPDDETDVRAMLADAAHQISTDTREGIETAIALILSATARYRITAQQLIDAIGLTKKQAMIYAASLTSGKRLAERTDKIQYPELRRDLILTELKKLPSLIAGNVRRVLQDFGGDDWTSEAADIAAQRLADKFKRFRTQTIARDATSTAAQTTELSVWKTAQLAGLVSTDARRAWHTQHDERVRHAHSEIEALNAGGVPLDAPFMNTLGVSLFAPPAELNCRCYVTLRHG